MLRKSYLYLSVFLSLTAAAVAQDGKAEFKSFKTPDAVPANIETGQLSCIANNLDTKNPDALFTACVAQTYKKASFDADVAHIVTLSGRVYDIVFDWATSKNAEIEGLFNPNTVFIRCARLAEEDKKVNAEACIISATNIALGAVIRAINKHPQRMAARASLWEALKDAAK